MSADANLKLSLTLNRSGASPGCHIGPSENISVTVPTNTDESVDGSFIFATDSFYYTINKTNFTIDFSSAIGCGAGGYIGRSTGENFIGDYPDINVVKMGAGCGYCPDGFVINISNIVVYGASDIYAYTPPKLTLKYT
jgi:hypothetical protein